MTAEELGEAFKDAMEKISDTAEFKRVMEATANHKDPEGLKRYKNANTDILSPEAKAAIDLSVRIKEAQG